MKWGPGMNFMNTPAMIRCVVLTNTTDVYVDTDVLYTPPFLKYCYFSDLCIILHEILWNNLKQVWIFMNYSSDLSIVYVSNPVIFPC